MTSKNSRGRSVRPTGTSSPLSTFWLSACMLLLVCTGCSQSEADPIYHDHGGHLVNLPGHEQMQLELAVDDQRYKLVVYVLETGTHAAHAISSEKLEITFRLDGKDIPISLDADPQPDDPEGRTSRFGIDFDEVPKPIHGAADFTATFTLGIQGETVSGTLHHKDDHTHDHHHD